MGLGTWEWIYTLVAVVDTVCLFSPQLHTLYVTTVFVDFLNSMWEPKKRMRIVLFTLWDNTSGTRKITPPLEALSILGKESFLQHRQWKQSGAPVQTGR